MFEWEKLGWVFGPTGRHVRPWMAEFAQAPATLLLPDAIRVFFSTRPPADEHGRYVSYGAYVDLDRRDPTRVLGLSDEPLLPLGGLGEFDEFGTYPWSVAERDGDVVAYYGGWTRCVSVPFNVAIGMAVSADGGRSFRRVGRGPVLSYSLDEAFVISGPKIRRYENTWYLFYIAGRRWKVAAGRPEPVYKIRLATSADGVNWNRAGYDLIPDRLEPDEAQASPDVFFANGRYHMFFCFRYSTDYRCRERGYRIGYAWSTDLLNWNRDDDMAGISVSTDGWDSEMVSYPHVFAVDETIYMAYLGDAVGRRGFGLARLVSSF